jgi:hypothetical protein
MGVLRRDPSIDFQSALSAGLDGINDRAVLGFAAGEGRILVSHDENSMPRHFREFISEGHTSPGVLLIPEGTSTRAAIENIIIIATASEAIEWENVLTWLPL